MSRSAEPAALTCSKVAAALPSVLDGWAAAPAGAVSHVETCLTCQAELARYRKLLRLLHQLRTYSGDVPPGAVADVLGAIEQAAKRSVIRSALSGRRLAYAGALVALPAAAGVAFAVARKGRLRRVPPMVLS